MKAITYSIIALLSVINLGACHKAEPPKNRPAISKALETHSETQSVTIGSLGLKVGDRFRISKTLRGENGPSSKEDTAIPHSQMTARSIMEEEMLAVVEGRRARWRVRIVQDEVSSTDKGQVKKSSSPLAGRTYVLWYEERRLQASTEQGDPVNKQVLAMLRGKYGPEEKKWRTIFDVLPQRKFLQNSPVKLPPEAVRTLDRSTDQLKSATITLRSVDSLKGTAKFDHEIEFAVPVPGSRTPIPMKFTGTFEASLDDGVFLHQELKGSKTYTQEGHECLAQRTITSAITRLGGDPK